MIPLQNSNPIAFSAMTHVAEGVGILWSEFMAAFAVGQFSPPAYLTPLAIYGMRYGFKVSRIAAKISAAQMIQFFFFWNRTNEQLVTDPMGYSFPKVAVLVSGASSDHPKPQPAAGIRLHFNSIFNFSRQRLEHRRLLLQ
jgi:hypothetical protein